MARHIVGIPSRRSRHDVVSFDWDWPAIHHMERELKRVQDEAPHAMVALLLEAGMMLEFHGKRLIRVDTGRLRASWGHFTGHHLNPSSPRFDPKVFEEAAHAAYFDSPSTAKLVVTVGTKVKYAIYVNYRLADFFAERALAETIAALPAIARQYLEALGAGHVVKPLIPG